MSIRSPYAAATEQRVRVPSKSLKRCQLCRFPAHCTQVVRWSNATRLLLMWLDRTGPSIAARSKIGQSEIKWQELLSHFRTVQAKHEKARRQALGADSLPFSGFDQTVESTSRPSDANASGAVGPSIRRRVAGAEPTPLTGSGRPALSPLNPKARQNGLLSTAMATQGTSLSGVMGSPSALALQQQKQRRPGTFGPVALSPRKG